MLQRSDLSSYQHWVNHRTHAGSPVRPDFLRQDARTPLSETFQAAGVRLSVATNSKSIMGFTREAFGGRATDLSGPSVSLRLWVDPSANSEPPWPKPHFRGFSHLIFGGLDGQNSFLIDLHTSTVLGRFSPSLASDGALWKTVIFPVMFSALAPSFSLKCL